MNDQQTTRQITMLLQRAAEDEQARNELYESVYAELRQSAHRLLANSSRGELQTTALVNEVLLRMEKSACLSDLANRKVFFSITAKAMRQVLIDHYRRRQKRLEENASREPLDDVIKDVEDQTQASFENLAEELDRLEQESPRQHAVIVHRYFGGRTVPETAAMLGVSEETVHRDWRLARAKLFRRLGKSLE